MAKFELLLPKMGESITEATILSWKKQVGDSVEEDETICEIATDKVDSEVPSPTAGVIAEILFQVDDVVEVGKVIAIINTEGEDVSESPALVAEQTPPPTKETAPVKVVEKAPAPAVSVATFSSNGKRFYSPLVKSIALEEGLSLAELEQVPGTGTNGRLRKKDLLSYLKNRTAAPTPQPMKTAAPVTTPAKSAPKSEPAKNYGDDVEVIEMDRMRKLIADHMVHSKKTSPHVTSYVEIDVTNLVNWRNKNKKAFQEKHGEKITFTPLFVEAVTKAINDFPMINVSVDGTNIIRKKFVNIGMAAALPNGNLIVPVIKDANYKNLVGLATTVNDLVARARANKLKPEEIQGGTFTITNVGTFGNIMGTPIINQPEVAILATGVIRKQPAVVETEYGDVIAVRQMMYLSLSYDHRVVDGFLGGSFLRRVGDYLENFDLNTQV